VEAALEIDHKAGIRPYPRLYPAALPFRYFRCLAGVSDCKDQKSVLRAGCMNVPLVGTFCGRGDDNPSFATWNLDFGSATGGVS
jgi:hypothetical protein